MRAYYPALNALGLIIMIFGLLMGFPLGVSMWLDDGATLAYDQSMFATFVVGLVIWVLTRGARREPLQVRDVLATPTGTDHSNIRALQTHGLSAVRFNQVALRRNV